MRSRSTQSCGKPTPTITAPIKAIAHEVDPFAEHSAHDCEPDLRAEIVSGERTEEGVAFASDIPGRCVKGQFRAAVVRTSPKAREVLVGGEIHE